MVKKVLAPGIVRFFDDTGPISSLHFAPPAQDSGVAAVDIEGRIGATEEHDGLQMVARHVIRVIVRRETLAGDRQVHEASIAGDKEVRLIEKGGKFQQAYSGRVRSQEDTTGKKRMQALHQVLCRFFV